MTATYFFILLTAIAALAAGERIGIHRLVRSPGGREWVRRRRLLHPNTLSLLRIPMGVATVALWHAGWPTAAMLWYALWMISDLTDGTIARHCGLGTETGKWLDPLSDKCLYLPMLVYFAWGPQPVLPMPWVLALAATDVLGQFSRFFTRSKAANGFGKAKTALITGVVALAALRGLCPEARLPDGFLYALTVAATGLAFLSLFGKVAGDRVWAGFLLGVKLVGGGSALWLAGRGWPAAAVAAALAGHVFEVFGERAVHPTGSLGTAGEMAALALGVGGVLWAGGGAAGPWLAGIYAVAMGVRLLLARPVGVGLAPCIAAWVTGTAALAFDGHPTAAAAVAAVAVALSCSSLRFAALGKSRWPRLPASVKATALVVLVTAAALRVSWPDGRGGVPTGLDLAALATAVATAIHLRRAAAAGDSAPETPSGAA